MAKKYSPEERAEAVKLAAEIGTVPAAKRLGINEDTLYGWIGRAKKQAQAKPEETQSADELRRENARLKKELAEKQMEVDILQDALGFFARSRKR